jgi:dihydroorotase
VGDVLVRDGLIEAICIPPGQVPSDYQMIGAHGCVVCPGFVDLHAHLRHPGFPNKENMASGTAAAAAGGFTTVCAMANTDPVVDNVDVLHDVYAEARRIARVHVRQVAAVTLGLEGRQLTQLGELAAHGAVAFSDDGNPVWDENRMRDALRDTGRLGMVISVHEEDPQIVGRGVANAGESARRLGLAEWPCEGESDMVMRDLRLLEQTGGRLHIAHVSCAQTVSLLRAAKANGLPVTAEVTPHHLCLTDNLLGGDPELSLPPGHPCTKVNPPLRSQHDVDALVEGLIDGTIDAIATDHAPHHVDDKSLPYDTAAFGISGLETALPLCLTLLRDGKLALPLLIARLTSCPASIFGLEAGSIQPGAPADICVFDPDRQWIVGPDSLQSMGKNTPLLGARLTGRIMTTTVDGDIAHQLAS